MTAKTPAERQEDLRARRLLLGLTEVRGIYAHPEDHKAIKEYAAKLQRRLCTSQNTLSDRPSAFFCQVHNRRCKGLTTAKAHPTIKVKRNRGRESRPKQDRPDHTGIGVSAKEW